MAQTLTDLTGISLGDCIELVDDSVLQSFTSRQDCPVLATLNFSGCFKISLPVLSKVLTACTHLKLLISQQNDQLHDTFLRSIPELSTSLIYLDVSACPNITLPGVISFQKQCPFVRRHECFLFISCAEKKTRRQTDTSDKHVQI